MRKSLNINSDIILQVLNQHSGLTWKELNEVLGLTPSHKMSLYNCLRMLLDKKFIIIENVPKDEFEQCLREDLSSFFPLKDNIYRVSYKWIKIHMVLNYDGWGYSQKRDDKYSMQVYPEFGLPYSHLDISDVFIAMPFEEPFDTIYKAHIANTIAKAKKKNNRLLSCHRADDLYTNNSIITDVWSSICNSSVVIADCTGRNPNVFYEIGIAHTVGTPTILITQNEEDIPVDLRHLKFIKYEYTALGMEQFEYMLQQTLNSIIGLL